jgi:GNAT superfamily N-acetyltransferase
MTKYLRALALLILRDYSYYHIYSQNHTVAPAPLIEGLQFEPVEKKQIYNSNEMMIVEQAWYHHQHTHAYACIEDSRIIGVCFFWYGEGYRRRNFWPLADQEAKLVQIFILPEMRGRGIGRSLIQFATQDMFRKGFNCVYARIWRSNTSSLRMFQQAGWNHIATVVELFLRGRNKPLRLEVRPFWLEVRPFRPEIRRRG